jgi:Membrane transporters of cations and cationic drugs
MKYILPIIYLIFTSLGIFLMKLGGDSLHLTLKGGFDLKIGWITLLGFLSYIVSFLLWQKLVATHDLSTMAPILTGIVQIIIFTLAIIFFKEQVNVYNIIGIILVIGGIIFLTIKK